MSEQKAYTEAAELISDATFYVEGHRRIFLVAQYLAQRSQPIDILTVKEELEKRGELDLIGGAYRLTELTSNVVSGAHVVAHCRILVEKFLAREVIRICGEKISEAYSNERDIFEVLEEFEREALAIRQNTMRKQFRFLDDVLVKYVQKLEELRKRDEHLTGVPSGYNDLDMVTCGWQETDLIILAARPSIGKTSLALTLARNAISKGGKAVGFFSIEMNAENLAKRLLSSESGLWLWNLTNARLDDEQMKSLYYKGVQPLANKPLIIDDTQSINVVEFRSKARRMVAKHGVGIIFVDYLQLMTVPSHISNREQQVSFIARELKATAKELNIPVIALAQMSREQEKGKWREPQLSDLRESGAIEQDADLVMFLWPPVDDGSDNRFLNTCYLGIKKHRNGALAKFVAEFEKETQRWKSLKVVDNVTLDPVGEKWRPVTISNYTESKREKKKDDSADDMPF